MRGTRRHVLGTAAATTLFSMAGLTVGVRPASGDIGAELSYSCTTPAGQKKIGLQIAGSVPASGSVGRAIEFGTIKLTADIDSADLSAFVTSQQKSETGAPGAPSSVGVTGTAKLSVSAVQGGRVTDAQWSPFPLQSAGDPQADKLKIAGTQTVPPLIPSAPEKIRLLANTLELNLVSGSGQSVGAPVSCAPDGAAELAAIGVDARAGSASQPDAAASGQTAPGQPDAPFVQERNNCAKLDVPAGYSNNDRSLDLDNAGKNPPGFSPDKFVPNLGTPFCINLAGFTNSNKVAGAVPVSSESLATRNLRSFSFDGGIYQQQRGVALALPDKSRATLLGFGFMPTTATAQAEQVPGENGDRLANFRNELFNLLFGRSVPGFSLTDSQEQIWVRANVSVLVSDASINGVPLDLGSNCRSLRNPLELHSLVGSVVGNTTANVNSGGLYTGRFSIPPFKNCGVGEDLSPLLTATASSGEDQGNFVAITASAWCGLLTPIDPQCASDDPKRPRAPLTISIEHGDPMTANLTGFTVNHGTSQIRCDSVRVRFQLAKGRWLTSLDRLGKLAAFDANGCVDQPAGIPVDLELVDIAPGFSNNIGNITPNPDGSFGFPIRGITLKLTGPNDCSMLLGNRVSILNPNVRGGIAFLARYSNIDPDGPGGIDPRTLIGITNRNVNAFENNCGSALPGFGGTLSITWPNSIIESSPRLKITSP